MKNIAVLGGGPSLEEDLKKIPDDCLLISCNHHAFQFVRADIMVYMDKPIKEMLGIIDNPKIRKIVHTQFFPKFRNTGHFGAWVASGMTDGKIYLCGMDLYQTDVFYENESMVWGGSENKEGEWLDVFKTCGNKSFIAVSGPLTKICAIL